MKKICFFCGSAMTLVKTKTMAVNGIAEIEERFRCMNPNCNNKLVKRIKI